MHFRYGINTIVLYIYSGAKFLSSMCSIIQFFKEFMILFSIQNQAKGAIFKNSSRFFADLGRDWKLWCDNFITFRHISLLVTGVEHECSYQRKSLHHMCLPWQEKEKKEEFYLHNFASSCSFLRKNQQQYQAFLAAKEFFCVQFMLDMC